MKRAPSNVTSGSDPWTAPLSELVSATPSSASLIAQRCDQICRFSLYALAVLLPISTALTEICTTSAILSWALGKLIRRDFRMVQTPLNTPILFFAIACCVSLYNTEFPGDSLRALFCKTGEYLLLYFVVVERFENLRQIRLCLGGFLISATLIAADTLYQMRTGVDFLRHYPKFNELRLTGSFKWPTSFAGWLIMLLPIGLSACLFDLHRSALRIWTGVVCAILIYALIFSYTKAAWIGFLTSLLFIGLLRKKRMVPVVLLLFLVLPAVLPRQMIDYVQKEIQLSSNLDRIELWKGAWNMFLQHPLIGIGLNTFTPNYAKFGVTNTAIAAGYAHNTFLQIMAELGLFGLMTFIWILAAFFNSTIMFYRSTRERFYRSILLGLVAGLIAFLVQSSVDTNLYSLQLAVLFWFIIGFTVSLQRALSRNRKVSRARGLGM